MITLADYLYEDFKEKIKERNIERRKLAIKDRQPSEYVSVQCKVLKKACIKPRTYLLQFSNEDKEKYREIKFTEWRSFIAKPHYLPIQVGDIVEVKWRRTKKDKKNKHINYFCNAKIVSVVK